MFFEDVAEAVGLDSVLQPAALTGLVYYRGPGSAGQGREWPASSAHVEHRVCPPGAQGEWGGECSRAAVTGAVLNLPSAQPSKLFQWSSLSLEEQTWRTQPAPQGYLSEGLTGSSWFPGGNCICLFGRQRLRYSFPVWVGQTKNFSGKEWGFKITASLLIALRVPRTG